MRRRGARRAAKRRLQRKMQRGVPAHGLKWVWAIRDYVERVYA